MMKQVTSHFHIHGTASYSAFLAITGLYLPRPWTRQTIPSFNPHLVRYLVTTMRRVTDIHRIADFWDMPKPNESPCKDTRSFCTSNNCTAACSPHSCLETWDLGFMSNTVPSSPSQTVKHESLPTISTYVRSFLFSVICIVTTLAGLSPRCLWGSRQQPNN